MSYQEDRDHAGDHPTGPSGVDLAGLLARVLPSARQSNRCARFALIQHGLNLVLSSTPLRVSNRCVRCAPTWVLSCKYQNRSSVTRTVVRRPLEEHALLSLQEVHEAGLRRTRRFGPRRGAGGRGDGIVLEIFGL
jgi:hypothetical protein